MCIAAIIGLCEIGPLDEHTVCRITPLATADATSIDSRLQAIAALDSITPEARPTGLHVLLALVRDMNLADEIVLAASRALLQAAGAGARAVIGERADRTVEPFKGRLFEIIA